MFLRPWKVVSREEAAAGGEQGDQRRTPSPRPTLLCDGDLGAVDGLFRCFEIDPRVGWELQVDLAAAAQYVAAEDGSHAGEQRAERGVGARRRAVWPQRLDQLITPGREPSRNRERGAP